MVFMRRIIYSLCNIKTNSETLGALLCQCRYGSWHSSPFLVDIGDVKVKYVTSRDPKEWKYVERALPPAVVPTPTAKSNYNSEWRPQGEDVQDLPYYIPRTKNHMIPVYLHVPRDGIKRTTIIRKIQGDIWLLEKEIIEFLQPQKFGPLRTQVNEFAGYIRIHGDFVNAIKYWLMQKKL